MTDLDDEAYDYFLGCVRVDEDVLDLIRDIAANRIDAEALVRRFDREHVVNLTGRIEGRVWHNGDAWVGDAFVGPMHGTARTFRTEKEAAYWVKTGKDVPDDMVERIRATAGPEGADPAWTGDGGE